MTNLALAETLPITAALQSFMIVCFYPTMLVMLALTDPSTVCWWPGMHTAICEYVRGCQIWLWAPCMGGSGGIGLPLMYSRQHRELQTLSGVHGSMPFTAAMQIISRQTRVAKASPPMPISRQV